MVLSSSKSLDTAYLSRMRWRIDRSLYGLKQAPRAWFQRFAGYATRIIDSLHKEFDMTDLGELNYFLGISATRHSTGLFLSQKKFSFLIVLIWSIVTFVGHLLTLRQNWGWTVFPVQDPTLYRSVAGRLQYLTFTRPDTVQQICLYMHDPREPHFAALKGYCLFLGDNLLSWSSKRQHTISHSSAEAEYRGVANVVAETTWIRNLLCELHSPLLTATLVYYDNVSAVYMSANPVQHQRMKHIEIYIHFVCDMVTVGHVCVLHVPSRFQYADIFTKGLPSALFEDFRSTLSVRPPPAQTAEAY
ncbi:ribonuclease H-like domain-containing protein [Tanacetum coccineum]